MTASVVLQKVISLSSTAADVARRIGAPIPRVLAFSPADDRIARKRVLCITLEERGVSVSFGSRFLSRVRLRGYRRFGSEGTLLPDAESVAASALLGASDLGATGCDVVLSIPRSWVIVRTVEFPLTVKENLATVISYELDRITPLTTSDAYYDFQVLDESSERIKVVLAAARAEVIQPYLTALSDNGLGVKSVTFNLSGIGTLCRFVGAAGDILYLEVVRDAYALTLYHKWRPIGSLDGILPESGDAAMVETLRDEIDLLGRNAPEFTPDETLLHLTDTAGSFEQLLRASLPAPVHTPAEIDLKLKGPVSARGLSPSALGAVVESLWPSADGLNLLTKGIHTVEQSPKLLSLLLALVLIGLFTVYALAPLWIEGKRLKEIDRQIAQRKEEVKKVESIKKEVELLTAEIASIDGFRANRPMALNLLKELTTILPKSAWLTRVRFADASAEIEGYATSATEILQKLESSQYFQKAEFASPTFKDPRLNADRFIIKMEIKGVKKSEPEKPKTDKVKGEKK